MRRASPDPPGGAARVPTFASLGIRNYRLYASGQLVSVIGTWMQNIATAWLALELSQSGTVLGIVFGARFLPILLLGPWGGVITDRRDVRRVMMASQAALACLTVLLSILAWGGWVTIPLLMLIQLGLGCAQVLDNPSSQSLINQLVDRRHLPNAIALNSTMINTAKVFGPGLAGVLIATVGVTPCFVLNALSYGAVILNLLRMRVSELHPAAIEARGKGQIRAGLKHVVHVPELRFPMLMVAVTGVLTWEFPVSLPLLVDDAFSSGAEAYGTAMACMGLGAIAGGLLAARRRQVTVRSLSISCILWGAVVSLTALAPNLSVAFALLLFVGAGSVTFNASAKTLLQLSADANMRGRVISLWSLAWQGGTVVGAPIVGLVASTWGARFGLLLGGVAALAIGALVLRVPARQGT